MNILIVAATIQEVLPFIKAMKLKEKISDKIFSVDYKNYHIDLLITGIGMVATTYNITKTIIVNNYNLAINVGIAGSFKKDIAIGETVHVIEDRFSELGAENGEIFLSIKDLNLNNSINMNDFLDKIVNPSINIHETIDILKKVKGITVNTIHGNEKSISKIIETYDPDIETMEGAAFMSVCLAEDIKFIQLRGISNYIEKRNKDNWNIPLAIHKVNKTILSLFEKEII